MSEHGDPGPNPTRAVTGTPHQTTREMTGANRPGDETPPATRAVGNPPPTRPVAYTGAQALRADASTTKLPPRFREHTMLGGGGEADAYLCEDLERNGELVVVKRYRPHARPDSAVLETLRTLDHPNLMRVLHLEPWDHTLIEVDEYLEFGTLDRQRLDPGTLEQTVLPQLAGAVAHCHERGILHRDLKPSNIYWRNRTRTAVALGDFGLTEVAFDVSRQDARRAWMSPLYAPPEAFAAAMADGDVGVSVSKPFDYYGLGMTLLVLLRGNEPTEEFADRSRFGELKMHNLVPLPESLPARWVTLLRGLMLADRRQRWGAAEVMRWLNGEDLVLPAQQPYRPGFRYRLAPGLEEVETPEQLARQLIEHPDEAVDDLEAAAGRMPVLIERLYEHYKPFDQPRAALLQGIPLRATSTQNGVLETALVVDPTLPYPMVPDLLAATPEDLARRIDANGANWALGRAQLFSGRIGVWLRCTGRGALLDEWAHERDTYARPQLHDAGLERFLHILDPMLSPPSLAVDPPDIDWRISVRDAAPTTTLTITNPGRGYLTGNLALVDSPTWFSVAETNTSFGVFAAAIASAAGDESDALEARFTVHASTVGLQRNAAHVHALTINANRPDETTVEVRLVERVPATIVGQFTAASAFVFGAVFALARLAAGAMFPSVTLFTLDGRAYFFGAVFVAVVAGLCTLTWQMGRQRKVTRP